MDTYSINSAIKHYDFCVYQAQSRAVRALNSFDKNDLEIDIRMLDIDISYMQGMCTTMSFFDVPERLQGMHIWLKAAKAWRQMIFLRQIDVGYGIHREADAYVA